jgi:hypothetical protein
MHGADAPRRDKSYTSKASSLAGLVNPIVTTKSSGPKDLGLEFSIPMFFIQGAEDFTTPTALARTYLDSIKAPRKELRERSGKELTALVFLSFQKAAVKSTRGLTDPQIPLTTTRCHSVLDCHSLFKSFHDCCVATESPVQALCKKDMSRSDHEENFRYGAKIEWALSVREVINRAVETIYCPHSSKHSASHAIRGDGVRVQ